MTKRRQRQSIGASIAEFGPALFVFFFIILFPLINLIAIGTGAATVYLIAKQCATKAGDSATFGDALISSEAAAYDLWGGGFGAFANLVPVGGFNNSGVDLFVVDTNISTNVSQRFGPNTPFISGAVNPDEHLYAYEAVATYEVGPFMNLNSVPFIGQVPGVGRPARLSYRAARNIEHPEGLQQNIIDVSSETSGPPPRDIYQNRNGNFL
ncbi:hypothetical protein KF913_18355 [Candidatus Obscuribacterales bacterium]|nr:hypothetical protein [Candidatus Obscuribacterales bacterium]